MPEVIQRESSQPTKRRPHLAIRLLLMEKNIFLMTPPPSRSLNGFTLLQQSAFRSDSMRENGLHKYSHGPPRRINAADDGEAKFSGRTASPKALLLAIVTGGALVRLTLGGPIEDNCLNATVVTNRF